MIGVETLNVYQACVDTLRRAGCRCPLVWDVGRQEAGPLQRCDIDRAGNDRRRCAFVDHWAFQQRQAHEAALADTTPATGVAAHERARPCGCDPAVGWVCRECSEAQP